MKTEKKYAITGTVVFIVWLVIAFSLWGANYSKTYYWIGIGFSGLAFAISEISIIFWKPTQNKSLTEVSALGYVISFIYLFLAIGVNLVFCLLGPLKGPVSVPIAVNMIILGTYVCVRMFAEPYLERTMYLSQEMKARINPYKEAQDGLVSIMSITDAPDVREALSELQELVSMSPTVSSGSAAVNEGKFIDCIEQIGNMIKEGQKSDQILEKIRDAKKLWISRNGKSTSV